MLPGLVRLDETASIISVVVQFRPGSNGIDKYLALLATGSGDERYQPAAIANIDRVRAIPFVLAAVLAMLAVLTLAHGMITSLRSRRRDLAVLRSLGADRRFVSRAVHWQATAFATLPAVIAAPFGFVAGRTLFTGYANGIGAVNDAAVPVVIVAAIITGVVLLANIVVAMPLHRERRLTTAAILKAE